MENGRKLLRWIALAAIAVIGLGGLVSLWDTPSQAGEIRADVIRIDAIGQLKTKLEMPPAVFLHDKHTKALSALGKDCSVCHTATQDGHTVKFLRQEDGKDAKKLEDLYHEGCISCHAGMAREDLETGPQDGQCRYCHDTNVPFTSEQAPIELGDKSLHYLHVSSEAITYPDSNENCGACHHVFDEKLQKLVWEKGKEDACAACHGDKADGNKPSLQTAMHTTCVWCHVTVGDASRKELIASVEAQAQEIAPQGDEQERKRDRKWDAQSAAERAAAIEAAIVTGPRTCAGCHTLEAQKNYEQVQDVPRLMRGQPDATVLLPVVSSENGESKRSVSDAGAGMSPVVFNHKAHEAATDSCRVCHHVRISACSDCHTVGGTKEGNFVTLSASMHDPSSDRSCVGCHQQQIMQKPECAGCHRSVPLMTPGSCASCHKDVKGISAARVADGSAFKMTDAQLAAVAEANIVDQPAPATALSPADIPDTVTIGSLSNEFEPSVMPHRKIYEALQKGIGDSGMAAAFHTSPTATCAACHHHSPEATLTAPPKCGSCHGLQADKQAVEDDRPSLKAAYHQQCMACHDLMRIEKPAATDCAGCHAPRKQ